MRKNLDLEKEIIDFVEEEGECPKQRIMEDFSNDEEKGKD